MIRPLRNMNHKFKKARKRKDKRSAILKSWGRIGKNARVFYLTKKDYKKN